jgi:hypothetical protein
MHRENIAFKVWPGVRVRSWRNPIYRKLIDEGLARAAPDSAEFGNAGVAAAHITLWQHLERTLPKNELALVLEDDEKLRPGFRVSMHD